MPFSSAQLAAGQDFFSIFFILATGGSGLLKTVLYSRVIPIVNSFKFQQQDTQNGKKKETEPRDNIQRSK